MRRGTPVNRRTLARIVSSSMAFRLKLHTTEVQEARYAKAIDLVSRRHPDAVIQHTGVRRAGGRSLRIWSARDRPEYVHTRPVRDASRMRARRRLSHHGVSHIERGAVSRTAASVVGEE